MKKNVKQKHSRLKKFFIYTLGTIVWVGVAFVTPILIVVTNNGNGSNNHNVSGNKTVYSFANIDYGTETGARQAVDVVLKPSQVWVAPGIATEFDNKNDAMQAWLRANPGTPAVGDGSGNYYSQADLDASKATPAPAGAVFGLNTTHVAEVAAIGDGSSKTYTQAEIDARDKAGHLPGAGAILGENYAPIPNTASSIPTQGPSTSSFSSGVMGVPIMSMVDLWTNPNSAYITQNLNQTSQLVDLMVFANSIQQNPLSHYFLVITETDMKATLKGYVFSTYQAAHDAWLTIFPYKRAGVGDGSGKIYNQAQLAAAAATPAPTGAVLGLNIAHVAEVAAVGDGSGNYYSQAEIDARDKAGSLPKDANKAVKGLNSPEVINTLIDAEALVKLQDTKTTKVEYDGNIYNDKTSAYAALIVKRTKINGQHI